MPVRRAPARYTVLLDLEKLRRTTRYGPVTMRTTLPGACRGKRAWNAWNAWKRRSHRSLDSVGPGAEKALHQPRTRYPRLRGAE